MQYKNWDKEYREKVFLTGSLVPQLDFRHFIKWLKKTQKYDIYKKNVIDLGCGNGKNSFYLTEQGAVVTGIDISREAIKQAEEQIKQDSDELKFVVGSLGEHLNFPDKAFDLAIDVLASNSLSVSERAIYLEELWRILKPGAFVFVKLPCLDGDKNAAALIEKFPGKEKGTYIMPKTGITEHVFTEEEIRSDFAKFQVRLLEKRASRTIFDGKPYNRKFWVLYLQKPHK